MLHSWPGIVANAAVVVVVVVVVVIIVVLVVVWLLLISCCVDNPPPMSNPGAFFKDSAFALALARWAAFDASRAARRSAFAFPRARLEREGAEELNCDFAMEDASKASSSSSLEVSGCRSTSESSSMCAGAVGLSEPTTQYYGKQLDYP